MTEKKQVFADATGYTVTLPDPHMVAPGTRVTIDATEWECVHEGEHAFWEPVHRKVDYGH